MFKVIAVVFVLVVLATGIVVVLTSKWALAVTGLVCLVLLFFIVPLLDEV